MNHSLHFEAKTLLHGLPVEEDKLSMVYGLEARVSFPDNDLVYCSMKISARDRQQGKIRIFGFGFALVQGRKY